MSIRLIAKELYRLQQQVEQLQEKLAAAPSDRRVALEEKLRIARAERKRMRDALDGQKEPDR